MHIGFSREAFVGHRGWLDECGYTDLVALYQILLGPTSSQVEIGVRHAKAGFDGPVTLLLGFSALSAVVLADRMPPCACSEHSPDVGPGEISTDIEQGALGTVGELVGEAVPEIERGGMKGELYTKVPPRLDRAPQIG